MPFDPDQPRDEKGQWTDTGNGVAVKNAASDITDEAIAKKTEDEIFSQLVDPKFKTVVDNQDDADKAMNIYFDRVATENEKNAVDEYTNTGYSTLNKQLRQANPEGGVYEAYPGENARTISDLDSFLAKAPKYHGVTYRGISYRSQDGFESFLKDLKDDNILQDQAYGSTSTLTGKADQFVAGTSYRVVMKIRGESGVYLGKASSHPGEKEVLFPRNTKFKVHSVDVKSFDEHTLFGFGEIATVELEEIK